MPQQKLERSAWPFPLLAEDPPKDPPKTDDSSKSGTLPTPGADEPLSDD